MLRWVMWTKTVSLGTRPVSDQRIGLGLGLAGLVLCCETRSCYARHHNDLEGHSNFSTTIYYSFFCSVLGTSLLWRSTVEFTYLKVKFVKCLCLPTVVLDSWSCYFGLGHFWSCLHHWHEHGPRDRPIALSVHTKANKFGTRTKYGKMFKNQQACIDGMIEYQHFLL